MKHPVLVFAALLSAAPFSMSSPASAATAERVSCAGASLRAVASRTHAKLTPCVATTHRFILETTYYQNASRVGGTALAAYPEARLRYGIAPRAELFVDAPSEIAKSGYRGAGIYTMTSTGFGAKYELARSHGAVYAVSAESHPPLGALANLNLVPLFDLHVSANWSPARGRSMGFQAGSVNYNNVRHTHLRSSALVAGWITQETGPRTSFTLELATQSNVYSKSRAQSSGVFSISQLLSQNLLFNIELGSAFNAQRNSKPHYLGAGFTVR